MRGFLIISACIGCYIYGIYSHSYNLWPIGIFRAAKELRTEEKSGDFDSYERLVNYPKQEIYCPDQTDKTAVILVIGQSNAANHAEYKNTPENEVINYFNGRCYKAASPLLGATGDEGEFLTLMGDMLIESGKFERVVLVPAAVGASSISRWQDGGDLNEMVQDTIRNTRYRITHIVWHQGERDFKNLTSRKVYADSFRSLLSTLPDVPIYTSISTKCRINNGWTPDNPVALAQRDILGGRVVLGADTDSLLGEYDRRGDLCHLSKSGQEKTARAYADAIR